MSPDHRQHRGAHPADKLLFGADQLDSLRRATGELSWLLSRGYQMNSSLKLVGDRHGLRERQRLALCRAACSDASKEQRAKDCLPVEAIKDQPIIIDGFNLIITLEAALGGGVLLWCRDGCLRDISSVHGTYRSVEETEKAIDFVGDMLATLAPKSVTWLLDKPISNSGRLARKIRANAKQRGWPWQVEVVFNPDAEIIASNDIAVSSDSSILDQAGRWTNFSRYLVHQHLPQAWIVDLNP